VADCCERSRPSGSDRACDEDAAVARVDRQRCCLVAADAEDESPVWKVAHVRQVRHVQQLDVGGELGDAPRP
jgi:hypothetical protein